MGQGEEIDRNFERFYTARAAGKVYPTEFVVRTFLATYPNLVFDKPAAGSKILDVAFGDGRNTIFLCEQGLDVSGIEITEGIVDHTRSRIEKLGYNADLRVGRNSKIPFDDDSFDSILACACCYYCDPGETMKENLTEYARVLKPGGLLIASVANSASYIFLDSVRLFDGSYLIARDPYNNREGYRLHGFANQEELKGYFSFLFSNFSCGRSENDYFGVEEKLFWLVCQKS